jgi:hypothetical protein
MNYFIIHAIHRGRALIFKEPLKGKRNFLFSMYVPVLGGSLFFQRKNRQVGERFLKAKKRIGCQSPKSFKRKFDTVATTLTKYSLPASMYTHYTPHLDSAPTRTKLQRHSLASCKQDFVACKVVPNSGT